MKTLCSLILLFALWAAPAQAESLLGAILYDPASAATKATSSLLAMTAVDTTNLRLTVVVPSHGMIRIKMQVPYEGATTYPEILLGAMVSSTVIGRVQPVCTAGATALATTRMVCYADFIVTGLTAGTTVIDAAYGVEIVLASTNLKYGGPNDTTTDNAWGAFIYQIFDPGPLTPLGLTPYAH
jgi:hypothetical protein